MKRIVKLALISVVIVSIIGVSITVESMAGSSLTYVIEDFTATANLSTLNIDVSWSKPNTAQFVHYHICYFVSGAACSDAYITDRFTTSWTHTSPTCDTTYYYDIAWNPAFEYQDDYQSAMVPCPPAVTSATFDESTNTITVNADKNLNAVKAANVCVYQTIKYDSPTSATPIFEPYDRCGSSGSVSGSTATVVVSGDSLIVNGTVTSESIGVATTSLQSTQQVWNNVLYEIWLLGGSN